MVLTVSVGGVDIPKTNRERKGKSIISFPQEYCVVDIETTGLSPEWNEIIEIGAIRYFDDEEIGRFQALIQPTQSYDGTYVDDFITELTGITNDMLKDAPTADMVIPLFAEFLGQDIVVGYNMAFDINFLYDAFMSYLSVPFSNNYVDVMRFAKKLYPEMAHHRLVNMIEKFGIKSGQNHRAIADVLSTKRCLEVIKKEAVQQCGTENAFIELFKKRYTKGSNARAANIVGDESKQDDNSPLYKRYCVFTGKLDKFSRQQAMQIVANIGGINEDNVTKKTNYLVLGNNDYCKSIKDGKSNKQKKAEKYKLEGQDIEIIPENVFYDMISEE